METFTKATVLHAQLVPQLCRRVAWSVLRLSSTAAAPSTTPSSELLKSHVGKVYPIPGKELKTAIPHALPKRLSAQLDTLGQAGWVFRQQSFDIIKSLFDSAEDSTAPKPRYLLYGDDGNGKTVCTYQVVHHCVKAGWLVVHVPGVLSWTHSKAELRPSAKHTGLYDQPDEACKWLKSFRTLNSKFISQMKLSEEYYWNKKEKAEPGEELVKVIEQGLLKPNLATEVVGAVLQEVSKLHKKFNVLLVVDQFNGCYNPTSFSLGRAEWAEPSQLRLVQLLEHYTSSPSVFSGPIILALSRTGMMRHNTATTEPLDLLGEKGFEHVKSYKHLLVPPFRYSEMKACLEYYVQEKWISCLTNRVSDSPSAVLKELWHVTAGNPRELEKLCAFC
ncbi:hypothetical protein EMCRGX_G021467 [Ephydatia muelleri]